MMHIKPEQLEFLDWEFGLFFHFGIRTFHEGHTDWDGKPMPAESFQPSALDFANWPSAFTEYSVKNAPWKNGRGDVVREFTDACRKYGLKIGLYYSPAQFGSVKMNAKEYDDYFIAQITELLTNYGRIDYLWFDGCGSEGHNYDTVRCSRRSSCSTCGIPTRAGSATKAALPTARTPLSLMRWIFPSRPIKKTG